MKARRPIRPKAHCLRRIIDDDGSEMQWAVKSEQWTKDKIVALAGYTMFDESDSIGEARIQGRSSQ